MNIISNKGSDCESNSIKKVKEKVPIIIQQNTEYSFQSTPYKKQIRTNICVTNKRRLVMSEKSNFRMRKISSPDMSFNYALMS
jgi:hypothetical protein